MMAAKKNPFHRTLAVTSFCDPYGVDDYVSHYRHRDYRRRRDSPNLLGADAVTLFDETRAPHGSAGFLLSGPFLSHWSFS
ncbi:hypothetical protein APED_06395 [Acanthopleuribacter pedis]